MGFKLGSERGNYAVSGEVKTKMRFGKNSGGDASVPGTPVIRKSLEKGVLGEANNDGTIFVSKNIEPNSEQERSVVMHEMKHMVDMQTGRLAYDDNSITWDGEKYRRLEGLIKYEGKWLPEGSTEFPWERH